MVQTFEFLGDLGLNHSTNRRTCKRSWFLLIEVLDAAPNDDETIRGSVTTPRSHLRSHYHFVHHDFCAADLQSVDDLSRE
jgi:hypothetical protein